MTLSLALLVCPGPAGSADQTPAFPELPRLAFENLPPTVRAEVQKAYQVVVAHPRDAAANGKLGMILHVHDFLPEAEACYRRAHLLDPTSFQWGYYLGLVQASLGNCDEAASTLREALRHNPDYLPAQLELGECLLGSGRWQEAAKLFEAILGKHPDRAEAYYGLGRVQAVRKDLNGAVGSFRKACELFPNFGAAHFALAHTYQHLGKTDQSLEELAIYDRNKASTPEVRDQFLDDIRALNPHPADPLRLGIALVREGRLEEAAAALEDALKSNPQLVEAHVKLASLYGQLGQPVRAEEHFQAAVRLDPNNPETYFHHGLLLASQGRFVEAEEAFRNALEINPQYPGAHLELGNMLEAQGSLTEALAEYQKALENHPDDARTHFHIGRILVNEEKYPEGIQHLLKSLSTGDEESQPAYLYALGAAYERAGDRANGLRYLRQAREKAVARGQSQLVQDIEDDLRTLETEGTPP